VLEKVNINTATVKEIMEHLGIGQYYAYRITGHRNKNGKFVSVEELKLVEGLAKDFYERYGDRCTIGEVETQDQKNEEEPEQQEPGKVNINTATAHEIHDVSGMHINYCYSICGHRKRNGPFRSLEELKGVKLITSGVYNKYKDYFVIDNEDESEPEEEPKSDKLNINTASLRELMAAGFEKRAAALIVNERKKFGSFRSVDDLYAIPEISGKILRKLRDNLEV
jgi:competence protein ComEA